jgi:hypothetical protein
VSRSASRPAFPPSYGIYAGPPDDVSARELFPGISTTGSARETGETLARIREILVTPLAAAAAVTGLAVTPATAHAPVANTVVFDRNTDGHD